MKRLIFVPQYPAKMRYQEWWINDFKKFFNFYYDEVIVLGENYLFKTRLSRATSDMFSPINTSIDFETVQINEYMNMDLHDNDTLLLADISFPGVFCNVLYHKPCSRMFAYCHATSKNKYDYFAPVRKSKFMAETAHSKLFDCVFVGSQYHQKKLGWTNTLVTALPDTSVIKYKKQKRTYDIISVCRPSIQKVDKKLEKKIAKVFGGIHREQVDTWKEYSNFLSKSKILLITTKEDTFNYTIMDAITCGCIPLAPRKLCFPEILDDKYLYNGIIELIYKIDYILKGELEAPTEMICQGLVDGFYDNIANIMID